MPKLERSFVEDLKRAERLVDDVGRLAAPVGHELESRHGIGAARSLVSRSVRLLGLQESLNRATAQALKVLLEQLSRLVNRLATQVQSREEELSEFLAPGSALGPEDYFDFEARFRGEEAEIRKRLEHYRPLLAPLSGAQEPVFEIGTGRGEFADLVSSLAIPYVGTEMNSEMVRRATAKGYRVDQADGFRKLSDQGDGSLSAIVSIHVIEHVSFPVLVGLVKDARRKLKPDGLLILETPNPLSLISAQNFHLDPSHWRPVHPLLLSFLAERNGFSVVRCQAEAAPQQLEKVPEDLPGAEVYNRNIQRLNEALFAGQDLVFVARKSSISQR